MEERQQEIKDIQFGSRRFQAKAKRISANRHVFLLDIPPTPTVSWLSLWMPQPARLWLQRLLPEWFLPTCVILKERNPNKADNYENEVDTYLHLQTLQGRCIPRLFGEVAIHNHSDRRCQISKRPIPAILLEHVRGVPIHSLPAKELGNPQLVEKLQAVYDLLTKEGVLHGDPELHNFLYVDSKIVAIDFEFSSPISDGGITNYEELETLKDQIEDRIEQEQGVKPVSLGSNLLFHPAGSAI
ncbi:hypothetical protein QBC38DRAFT_494452 [Podospora fimiseda]|uniref:Protein kinase domain-containing protein n=1 Tax=Podospora fimiseda TaxID=252190 RepID=A0AAN6YKX9_9PEZI|nr:hypothetical protein QBC38DRAFT_494452 [Podospora fimiseda]